MKIINYEKLSDNDKKYLDIAKETAKKSVSEKENYVGAVIVGDKSGVYKGATVARTRVIGSTCSERMALDNFYFNNKEVPRKVFTIGTFERKGWSDDYICSPCGVCLEMIFEAKIHYGVNRINFFCSSWNKKNILVCELNDLFPQIGKGGWSRK